MIRSRALGRQIGGQSKSFGVMVLVIGVFHGGGIIAHQLRRIVGVHSSDRGVLLELWLRRKTQRADRSGFVVAKQLGMLMVLFTRVRIW